MAARICSIAISICFLSGFGSLNAEDPPADVDVAAAVKQLERGNRGEKLTALDQLKHAAAHEKLAAHKAVTIKLCAQLLHQQDRDLGNAACDVLSWLDADAIPPLVQALESKDPWVLSSAALVISSIAHLKKPDAAKTDIAILPLAKLLRSEDKSARHNAFYAISELGPQAIPHLIGALDAEEYFQTVMMRGFVRLGRESVEPLCKALRTGSVTTRQNAAFMLFHISWQAPEVQPLLQSKAITPLTEAIDDQDQLVRSRAIDTLGRMDGRAKPSLDKILAALGQPDAPFASIANAAGRIGPQVKDLPALFGGAQRMHDQATSTNDRERAVQVFGQAIGTVGEQAVDHILKALDDDRPSVRQTAMWALFELGPKAAPAVPALIRKLNGGDPLAPVVLGEIGPLAEQAVPDLIRRLEHDEWLQSRLAFAIGHHSTSARALAAIGRPAIPALLQGLKHKDDLVRVGCVVALEEMDPKAMPPLSAIEPLCRDDNAIIRAHAMLVLVRHGLTKERLLPILQRLQEDSHPGVAGAARHELQRL